MYNCTLLSTGRDPTLGNQLAEVTRLLTGQAVIDRRWCLTNDPGGEAVDP
jgi:hypothetical protein